MAKSALRRAGGIHGPSAPAFTPGGESPDGPSRPGGHAVGNRSGVFRPPPARRVKSSVG